jgi:glutathione-regulated potassium-efflux system ancillary protein KefG
MPPEIDTDDLTDAAGVAEIIGLKGATARNIVSTYQRRYPDMPRPVVNLGRGRPMLWSRAAIEKWARETGRLK